MYYLGSLYDQISESSRFDGDYLASKTKEEVGQHLR